MGTMYKDAIFCGDMGGKLTPFNSTDGTALAAITTPDANGPIRIDSLTASTDDVANAFLRLFISDNVNTDSLGVVALKRPVKNVVSNVSNYFTWAATSITRATGSWLADGYNLGSMPIIQDAPYPADNLLGTLPITALSDTVMTINGAGLVATAAQYSKCTIAMPDNTPACTDLLAADALSGLIGHDAAGNEFLELPKGWALWGALVNPPTSGKTVTVQARWGTYAAGV